MKVDNITDVLLGQNRSSVYDIKYSDISALIPVQQVRITTQDTYELGSLWIIDLNHIPYGCSVCYERPN